MSSHELLCWGVFSAPVIFEPCTWPAPQTGSSQKLHLAPSKKQKCSTGNRSCPTPHHAVSFEAGKRLLPEAHRKVSTKASWAQQDEETWDRPSHRRVLQQHFCLLRTTVFIHLFHWHFPCYQGFLYMKLDF